MGFFKTLKILMSPDVRKNATPAEKCYYDAMIPYTRKIHEGKNDFTIYWEDILKNNQIPNRYCDEVKEMIHNYCRGAKIKYGLTIHFIEN